MNKSINTQTKKVVSAAKYLASIMYICNEAEIQDIIIPAISPKGWVWQCDGKTAKECYDNGYSILDDWCIEIPQNQNIDFWRNYSN